MKENKKKTTLGRSILNMFGGLFSNSYKDVDNEVNKLNVISLKTN